MAGRCSQLVSGIVPLHHAKTGTTVQFMLYSMVRHSPDIAAFLQHIMSMNPKKGAEFLCHIMITNPKNRTSYLAILMSSSPPHQPAHNVSSATCWVINWSWSALTRLADHPHVSADEVQIRHRPWCMGQPRTWGEATDHDSRVG
jgi:hypothetical protein